MLLVTMMMMIRTKWPGAKHLIAGMRSRDHYLGFETGLKIKMCSLVLGLE